MNHSLILLTIDLNELLKEVMNNHRVNDENINCAIFVLKIYQGLSSFI